MHRCAYLSRGACVRTWSSWYRHPAGRDKTAHLPGLPRVVCPPKTNPTPLTPGAVLPVPVRAGIHVAVWLGLAQGSAFGFCGDVAAKHRGTGSARNRHSVHHCGSGDGTQPNAQQHTLRMNGEQSQASVRRLGEYVAQCAPEIPGALTHGMKCGPGGAGGAGGGTGTVWKVRVTKETPAAAPLKPV